MRDQLFQNHVNKIRELPDVYKVLRYLGRNKDRELTIKQLINEVYVERRSYNKNEGLYDYQYKPIARKRAEYIIDIFEWIGIVDVDYRDRPKKYFEINERGQAMLVELQKEGEAL